MRPQRYLLAIAAGLLMVLAPQAIGEAPTSSTFDKVKVRRNKSESDRRLVDKNADLTFDDAEQAMVIAYEGQRLRVKYSDVIKVLFDTSSHMRGGAAGTLIGGVVGAAISAKGVTDYWFYFEYKDADGKPKPFLMEVYKEEAEQFIQKATAVFGDRVAVVNYPAGSDIDKNTLKALQAKHEMKPNKSDHVAPELKPDKALVVVVCPPLAARYSGGGNQFKLHANDEVVAVNKMGTYSIAYLTPGKYRLVSQSENAHGMELELEAGKDYYFLQNVWMGTWKGKTTLSQHSKELVTFEMNGAWQSDWKAK